MKNTRLKNVIFTAGMAVFTGVLLLGVNAAIGAATPTVDPPGAGVSPTFTGLNVNGNIQNSAGNVSVSDNLAVTGNVTATQSISAIGNVNASGNVSVSGNANITGNAGIIGDANINGDVDVSGALSADSLITPNISNADSNAVVINDGLAVNGPGASRIDGSFINVNAVLRANESIINHGDDPVLINDNFVVTGTSDLRGNVSNSTDFFTIDDDVIITSGNTVINQGDLEVQGYAYFDGAVTAERFGTYTRRVSNAVPIPDQMDDGSDDFEHRQASKACNAGEILVSCGGYASGSSASYSWTRWVIFDRIESNGNTCYLEGTNTNTFANQDRYITAVAICLDPDL